MRSPHTVGVNAQDAISRIKSIEPTLRAMGAATLYLFGSTARNEAKSTSDVDLFVDLDPAVPNFSLFDLMHMEEEIAKALGTRVDLGTRSGLHPVLKDEIEQSAIRIF